MHRQGQNQGTVRVRLQGVGGDLGHQAQRRPVCAACTKALHGNPFDGHTLGPVVAELEALTGIETRRIHVDKCYRGHNHAQKFRVWISGQVRRVTAPIRREMRRRAAVEPVIGHIKAEHRMGRNYLKGRDGDRINAVLAAAGSNFSLLLRWLERLLRALIRALLAAPWCRQTA
jgi:IS5 family transposase